LTFESCLSSLIRSGSFSCAFFLAARSLAPPLSPCLRLFFLFFLPRGRYDKNFLFPPPQSTHGHPSKASLCLRGRIGSWLLQCSFTWRRPCPSQLVIRPFCLFFWVSQAFLPISPLRVFILLFPRSPAALRFLLPLRKLFNCPIPRFFEIVSTPTLLLSPPVILAGFVFYSWGLSGHSSVRSPVERHGFFCFLYRDFVAALLSFSFCSCGDFVPCRDIEIMRPFY